MPFVNSVRGTFGPQGRLNRGIQTLGTLSNPATNGVALWDAGIRESGLYYISTSQGTKQVYVDLATIDATTNKAGWMLVASWSQASNWSIQSTTSTDVFNDSTAKNCFSANFGTMPVNFVRMQVSSSIASTATNATSADFYHYSSSAAPWREWWVTDSSNNIVWSTTTNLNTSGVPGDIPREAMRQFTSSYNLKFGYSVNQIWQNLSDGASAPIIGRQGDWWNGLNGTATGIGWNGANDGSLSILPQGSPSNGSGQDCNENQTKFGSDDTASVGATPNVAWFGTTATANLNNNTGFQGSDTNLWMWIK